MTYTTRSAVRRLTSSLFMDYVLLFLNDIHNPKSFEALHLLLFMDYVLLFLNDIHNTGVAGVAGVEIVYGLCFTFFE